MMFRTGGWRAFLLCLLLVSPALLWIALDRAPFGGDPSHYAGEAVSLFDTLVHSPLRWPSAMAHAFGIKAPGIAWIGQLFVPLGALLGSIDAGLLLSVAAAQLAALLLTFRSLRELADDDVPSLAGCLVIASAPLSVQLVHEYVVETLQMMATAYFVLILAFAPRWTRARVLAHLLLAGALALLAKASSPLFCFAPGLLALAWALAPSRRSRPWGWSRLSTLVPLIAGSLLALATLVWYFRNLDAVGRHMAAASSGTVALYWGKDEPFLPSLSYWLGTLGTVLLWGTVAVIASSAFVVASVLWLVRRRGPYDHFAACALVALLEIAAVLTVFSLAQNRTGRYLLPVLPYCALLVAWTLAQLRGALVQRAGILVFAAQFALVQAHAFGVLRFPSLMPWVRQLDTRGASRAVLDGIVDRTCNGQAPTPYLVIVGVDPSPRGDWLAPIPANYVAAKRQLRTSKPTSCHYDYLGGSFFGATASQAWTDMVERQARYFVTVDPGVYPARGRAYNRALDAENFPALLRDVRESGLFEAEPPLRQDQAVWIFRRRDGAAP